MSLSKIYYHEKNVIHFLKTFIPGNRRRPDQDCPAIRTATGEIQGRCHISDPGWH